MNIPFFDLNRQYAKLKDDIFRDLDEFFKSTAYSSGKYVEQFERDFAEYNNVKYAVAVSSGVAALHLALLTLGIKEGDEVIVPVNTFISSANAIVYTGAKPVFVDIDEHTWNVDITKIEAAITNRTKAIMVVHLYGTPANIDAVLSLAKQHRLKVIEDTAQAHGAIFKNQNVGTFGDIGCFSFYPSKNLGAYGEGGALILNDKDLVDQLISLRNCGKVNDAFPTIGYNYRMHGFQGFILSKKLVYLDAWNLRRRAIAALYLEQIKNDKIIFQKIIEGAQSVYHLFVVHVKEREKFIEYLRDNGIGYAIHYKTPLHLERAYQFLNYKNGDFTIGEYHANKCVSLPLFPEMTDEEVDCVIEMINKF